MMSQSKAYERTSDSETGPGARDLERKAILVLELAVDLDFRCDAADNDGRGECMRKGLPGRGFDPLFFSRTRCTGAAVRFSVIREPIRFDDGAQDLTRKGVGDDGDGARMAVIAGKGSQAILGGCRAALVALSPVFCNVKWPSFWECI